MQDHLILPNCVIVVGLECSIEMLRKNVMLMNGTWVNKPFKAVQPAAAQNLNENEAGESLVELEADLGVEFLMDARSKTQEIKYTRHLSSIW